MLKPGDDPRRVLPRHQERGPQIYQYSLQLIAEAAKVEYQTVRKAVTDKRLDPKDLRSVAAFIQQALTRRCRPIEEEEASSVLPAERRGWWDKRWPRFRLYRCANPECEEILLSPGACSAHGGDRRPGLRFDSSGYVCLLVGNDYVPLHKLIVQAQQGMHTHHRDGNPWNNHWANLECLTPAEHADRHVGGVLSGAIRGKQPPRKPLRIEQED